MKQLTSRAAVAIALALIAVTNLVILAEAGFNRRGEPLAELTLTERELAMPGARQDDGTGLELSLMLTNEPPGVLARAARWKHALLDPVEFEWLDRDKLVELGFGVDRDPGGPEGHDDSSRALTRRVYLVVEYDGEAWRRWIAGREETVRRLEREAAEAGAVSGPGESATAGTGADDRDPTTLAGAVAEARALLALDRTMRSRLFPVDAGLDAAELRRRYADSPRHAIVEASIRPRVSRAGSGAPRLTGVIARPIVSRVTVSRALLPELRSFLPEETWSEVEARESRAAEDGWPEPVAPRYEAVIKIGRRHEPWLVSITPAGNG